MRTAALTRTTSETEVALELDIDGTGQAEIDTGIGFLDHMLTALARHAQFDLRIKATGDLEIDAHHTTEDVGIVLGAALAEALGDKRGISRYGHASVPMDEALVDAALDISGRAFLAFGVRFNQARLGEMDTELFEEFFRAMVGNARITLHLNQRAGSNTHHVAEACFKAVARALRQAVEIDPQMEGVVPSTRGRCENLAGLSAGGTAAGVGARRVFVGRLPVRAAMAAGARGVDPRGAADRGRGCAAGGGARAGGLYPGVWRGLAGGSVRAGLARLVIGAAGLATDPCRGGTGSRRRLCAAAHRAS